MIGFARALGPVRVFSALLGLAVLTVGLEAHAVPTYLSTAKVECFTDITTSSGPVPGQFESCDTFGVTASANVDSDVGVIRAQVACAIGAGSSVRAVGVARFQDSFLVTALDAGGASVPNGFLTVTVFVDTPIMLPETQGPGSSFLGSNMWNYSVGTASNNGRTLLNVGSGNTGGLFTFEIPWTDGTPVDILFFANLDVRMTSLGTPTAAGDFTIAWRGITAVTDSSGVPVQSFTAFSAEGFDYAADTMAPATTVPILGVRGFVVMALLLGTVLVTSMRRPTRLVD